MRRAIIAGLALLLMLGTGQGEARQVSASTRLSNLWTVSAGNANRGEWRWERCRFRNLEGGPAWSVHEVELTIRCAVRRWPVPGGVEGALCIAEKESGLNEWADNPYSTAAGVYQFLASTWESVKASFPMPWWGLYESVHNARSNVVRAIRKAKAEWSWRAWNVRYLCGLG